MCNAKRFANTNRIFLARLFHKQANTSFDNFLAVWTNSSKAIIILKILSLLRTKIPDFSCFGKVADCHLKEEGN